ncbi:MAG TPA: mucoidy inhibitor MuiA family protein [Gemmataceae bacterium]|nr:mucoidy inhibitor MuiA family protein [Gemmataceae bacterium]
MNRLCLLAVALVATSTWAEEPALPPKLAPHQVIGVTVYPTGALVTREVTVPEGIGSFELVVTPLPPQTVNSSLYSEGTHAIQVLTTRYRQRPIKEDTREEVRKAEAQLKQLQATGQKLDSEKHVIELNLAMLGKLEAFTGATLQHLTDKGQFNGDATIALSRYIMESRAEKSEALVANRLNWQTNQEQMQFVQRQLQELAAGSNKTERDAVIVVDKREAPSGKVRLNYLVDSASWRPQYKFRALNGKGKKEEVQLEYLAAVIQQTGEDWSHVNLVLSTAEPMLNAAPPELKMLEVAVARIPANPAGGAGAAQNAMPLLGMQANPNEYSEKAKALRGKAQLEFKGNNEKAGGEILNSAAALEQTRDLLVLHAAEPKIPSPKPSQQREGPSVNYTLNTKLTIPSRNDEQIIEVAKIDLTPDYFYKAVPVLTPHIYRLANLTNTSQYVLLPGEATMYIGTDFVGRANLPLVATGEQFTAGFGVDPQLQVQRQMIEKTKTMQGDNQVLRFEYRILVSSYKTSPVKVQVWDRLPHTETEAVGVSLVKTKPDTSTEALYLREDRPHNLLRWDLTVEPAATGEKALAIQYEFKLELGRLMQISNFAAK